MKLELNPATIITGIIAVGAYLYYTKTPRTAKPILTAKPPLTEKPPLEIENTDQTKVIIPTPGPQETIPEITMPMITPVLESKPTLTSDTQPVIEVIPTPIAEVIQTASIVTKADIQADPNSKYYIDSASLRSPIRILNFI